MCLFSKIAKKNLNHSTLLQNWELYYISILALAAGYKCRGFSVPQRLCIYFYFANSARVYHICSADANQKEGERYPP